VLERLEPRRLFDATLTNGLLTVTGTSGDDRIEIFSRFLGKTSDGRTIPERPG
jgi:hypothetical protein